MYYYYSGKSILIQLFDLLREMFFHNQNVLKFPSCQFASEKLFFVVFPSMPEENIALWFKKKVRYRLLKTGKKPTVRL